MQEELLVNKSPRLSSIDMVRGLVMCIMALDHVRDFFYFGGLKNGINPLDPSTSHLWLYLSRWITHTCAPSFVFLAGLSIYFQKSGRKNQKSLPWTLFSRGVWLILLELTLINSGWTFKPFFQEVYLQVIWTLGAGFVCMALLHKLPARVALSIGIAIIFFHNLLDSIQLHGEGVAGLLWALAHEMGFIQLPGGGELYVPYPFLPWLGIMLSGFGCGPFFMAGITAEKRRTGLWIGGFLLVLSFAALRLLNLYGDPNPWQAAPGSREFWYQFFDVSKYPPSLLFSLATLACLSFYLWLAEKNFLPFKSILLTFGRVPFFFYFLHVPLIHGLSLAAFYLTGKSPDLTEPQNGFGLPACYLIWLGVLLILLLPCRWFESVKARNQGRWWTAYS